MTERTRGSSKATGITGRQQSILDYILEIHRTRGYPPTVREIGEAVGLQSPSSVHAQLATLVDRGLLKKDPTRPRAIVVTSEGMPQGASTQSDNDFRSIPLLGMIAAGAPILAEQNVEDTLTLPQDVVGHGTLFALTVRGESMIDAGILDGDTVIIRQQPTANDGDIIAALVDGEEATVKTLRTRGGKVILEPANSAYEPIEADEVQVLGKVVTVLRKL